MPGKYGRILAERKTFGPDEPVFLLRAQDRLAPDAVTAYAALLRAADLDAVADSVDNFVAEMIAWQAEYPQRVKWPD